MATRKPTEKTGDSLETLLLLRPEKGVLPAGVNRVALLVSILQCTGLHPPLPDPGMAQLEQKSCVKTLRNA